MRFYWWLARVTLLIAFGFPSKCWEVVGGPTNPRLLKFMSKRHHCGTSTFNYRPQGKVMLSPGRYASHWNAFLLHLYLQL